MPPSPLHILGRDRDHAQHVAASSVFNLDSKRVRAVGSDEQEISYCPKPLRSSKQVGIGLQWKHRGAIIEHHEWRAAMIIDNHGRIAAIAML